MNTTRIMALCLAEYYLPGYKGGGPVRTIANMSDAMSSDVEFWIFTRDRDLGSDVSYSGVQVNSWNRVNNAHVYYASPNSYNSAGLAKAIEGHRFDIIYLNSFFSYRASISVYLGWRLGKMRGMRLLVAPRGEFSKGALALKGLKKQAFLAVSRLLGLYSDVHWHASTVHEAEDILRVFPGSAKRIHLAADPVTIENFTYSETDEIDNKNALQIVFISRITPKKNLDGLLEILLEVKSKVNLSIFGPIEDEHHWQQCQVMMAAMPNNINIEYCGVLDPNDVSRAFARYDLFVFPTHGENFGHVIFESLRVGTPVLLSDQTPWQQQPEGAITVLPLSSRRAWVDAIESAAHQNAEDQRKLRIATIEYARRYMSTTDSLSENVKMFHEIVSLYS